MSLELMEYKLIKLSNELGVNLQRNSLREQLRLQSVEKDALYEECYRKLQEIQGEIERTERLLKQNVQFVENSIVPQLKATNQTYKELRKNYLRMKGALSTVEEEISRVGAHIEVTRERQKENRQEEKAS